jgi:hypothetical protein
MSHARSTEGNLRATGYRKLAHAAEQYEATCDLTTNDRTKNGVDYFFTCNRIAGSMGYEERACYRDLMVQREEENELWQESDCMSIRVLMLCFMAAMVEAGDA